MVVLKRIEASTLVETLLASVLIVIVFMLASMILNNIFSNSIKNNTQYVDNRIHELQYLEMNDELTVPYEETVNNWQISIKKKEDSNGATLIFEALNLLTTKQIIQSYIEPKS